MSYDKIHSSPEKSRLYTAERSVKFSDHDETE